jgi:hypothetical protein
MDHGQLTIAVWSEVYCPSSKMNTPPVHLQDEGASRGATCFCGDARRFADLAQLPSDHANG